MTAAQWFNLGEAILWFCVGVRFGFRAFAGAGAPEKKSRQRMRLLAAAMVFLAFGASDLVEIQTGAWWHPWWLLVWKGSCIARLIALWRFRPRS